MQYLNIMEAIRVQIDTGALVGGHKLPSERKLAAHFNTTRITLRESLALLEAEGKIYREDRRGWFVSPEPLHYDPTMTTNFSNMAKSQGRTARSELLSAKLLTAGHHVTKLLGLPNATKTYRIDRLRYLDDRPVMVLTNFINPEYFPGLLELDVNKSLTRLYREHYDTLYVKTNYRVNTTSLLGETAQALRTTSGTPAMFVERLNYDQHNNKIDCDFEYWRHDAISIESMAILDKNPQ